MLNQIDLSKKTPKGTYAKQFDKKSAELGYLGRALRDAKVPVIILFEGFRGTYRGKLINKVISALIARIPGVFRVKDDGAAEDESLLHPVLERAAPYGRNQYPSPCLVFSPQ